MRGRGGTLAVSSTWQRTATSGAVSWGLVGLVTTELRALQGCAAATPPEMSNRTKRISHNTPLDDVLGEQEDISRYSTLLVSYILEGVLFQDG